MVAGSGTGASAPSMFISMESLAHVHWSVPGVAPREAMVSLKNVIVKSISSAAEAGAKQTALPLDKQTLSSKVRARASKFEYPSSPQH